MKNMTRKRPVMLVVMDGFGLRDDNPGNAIVAARKPNLDYLFNNYPHTTLNASGEAVGLPDGQMGTAKSDTLTWARTRRLSIANQGFDFRAQRELIRSRLSTTPSIKP